MSDGPALLDVNVPMYAAGRAHPYKESCVWLMTEVTEGRIDVVIDTEIVQEILYRFGTSDRWQTGVTMARSLMMIVPAVLPVTEADMWKATELFAHHARAGVSARDTLHAAVILNRGIDEIISTDRHFDRFEGITRLDPRTLHGDAASG